MKILLIFPLMFMMGCQSFQTTGVIFDEAGNVGFRDLYSKRIHREGAPAIYLTDGTRAYFKQGRLHREDGPAIITKDELLWYENGKLIKRMEI